LFGHRQRHLRFGNTASIVAANESEMAAPKLELTI
jgi:hypothetical protein